MSREEHNIYFEMLELDPDATLSEVRNAYFHLKKLYSTDSIVTLPVADEFLSDSRQEILQQIEEAYTRLVALFENGYNEPESEERSLSIFDDDHKRDISDITSFSGQILRELREKRGIELHELALATKIRIQYFENIEREEFDSLPPPVYIRGYVVNYARYLSLDPKKVADDYMDRYKAWKMKS